MPTTRSSLAAINLQIFRQKFLNLHYKRSIYLIHHLICLISHTIHCKSFLKLLYFKTALDVMQTCSRPEDWFTMALLLAIIVTNL